MPLALLLSHCVLSDEGVECTGGNRADVLTLGGVCTHAHTHRHIMHMEIITIIIDL